jgi:hypothetical protein
MQEAIGSAPSTDDVLAHCRVGEEIFMSPRSFKQASESVVLSYIQGPEREQVNEYQR